jgi:hypothetical protein
VEAHFNANGVSSQGALLPAEIGERNHRKGSHWSKGGGGTTLEIWPLLIQLRTSSRVSWYRGIVPMN